MNLSSYSELIFLVIPSRTKSIKLSDLVPNQIGLVSDLKKNEQAITHINV